MGEDEILDELRTIRILLAIDKRDYLESILEDFDDIHRDVLEQFSSSDWSSAGTIQEELSQKHDVSVRTVRNRQKDLVDTGFLLRRQNSGTFEYKKSGLVRTIELFG